VRPDASEGAARDEFPNLQPDDGPPPGELRIAVAQTATLAWDLDRTLAEFHSAAVPAIALYRPKLAGLSDREVVARMERSQVAVSSLGWVGGFVTQGQGGTAAALYDAMESLPLAAAIGCRTLRVALGSCNGFTPNHARRIVVDAVRRLAWQAVEFGVRLALDGVCSPQERFRPIVSSDAESESICDEIGAPNVGVVIRAGDWSREGALATALHEAGERAYLVRIEDDLRLAFRLQELSRARFPGYVEIDAAARPRRTVDLRPYAGLIRRYTDRPAAMTESIA